MELNLPVIAGSTSTVIFALSTLPMLRKAFQTKDLRSYSLANILLANTGNMVHSIYVFDLPPGPIWLLHSFYLLTTGLMLIWYLRYEWRPRISRGRTLRRFSGVSTRYGSGRGRAQPDAPFRSTATGPSRPVPERLPRGEPQLRPALKRWP